MGTYYKKDILKIPKQELFVADLKAWSDKHLEHLFTLTPEQIANVLTALAFYCEER